MQVAAALLTVLALAAWQFSRGLEKTALQDARLRQLRAAPVTAAAVTAATADFRRVSLSGYYDAERQFWVASRPGAPVQVVSPLRTATGVFLVNRGWAPAPVTPAAPAVPAARRALATPTDRVTVTGVVWPLMPLPSFVDREPWPADWPKPVRAMNPARMAAATGAWPREIRLQAGTAGVFQAASLDWDDAPGKHWSYTVQWLLIGLAIGAGYLVIGRRRRRARGADG